jgi:hypothetical protein
LLKRLSPARFSASHSCQDRLTEYKSDESLGRNFDLLLTVKSEKQKALNRVMLQRSRDGVSMKVLGGRTPRAYRKGLLVYLKGDSRIRVISEADTRCRRQGWPAFDLQTVISKFGYIETANDGRH